MAPRSSQPRSLELQEAPHGPALATPHYGRSKDRASAALLIVGFVVFVVGTAIKFNNAEAQVNSVRIAGGATMTMKEAWDFCDAVNMRFDPCVPAMVLMGISFVLALTATVMERYVAGPLLLLLSVLAYLMFTS